MNKKYTASVQQLEAVIDAIMHEKPLPKDADPALVKMVQTLISKTGKIKPTKEFKTELLKELEEMAVSSSTISHKSPFDWTWLVSPKRMAPVLAVLVIGVVGWQAWEYNVEVEQQEVNSLQLIVDSSETTEGTVEIEMLEVEVENIKPESTTEDRSILDIFKKDEDKEDDWELDLAMEKEESGGFMGRFGGGRNMMKSVGAPNMVMESAMAPMADMAMNDSLGFAVGGAKDINNFRENIENDYLPLPTDVTHEGLYYDYFFDTGKTETCEKLFCPSYSLAITPDPLSGEDEYYMAVGLNSGMKASDFERKKLNLVVVLDISGSMGSSFDQYYYDGSSRDMGDDAHKSKMDVAKESVVALTKHLKDDDRFGMVVFDNSAFRAKPLNLVEETDMDAIRAHIGKIYDKGGTNMEAGFREGTELLTEIGKVDPTEYETRIIFLTDAMPNQGQISEEGLFGLMEKNARDRFYTTFVGIGVDFNTELVESITKVKGANYFSVHSPSEFKKLMDDDFDYMVTPLVFDLSLELDSSDVKIEKVYGSPEADEATGQIMKVNTLFPSRTENGETKGGLVLLKLDSDPRDKNMTIKTSFEHRSGSRDGEEQEVVWDNVDEDPYFANTGIRKGVLLSRYANLMINWLLEERSYEPERPIFDEYPTPMPMPCPLLKMDRIGICPPPWFPHEPHLSKWERGSQPLTVPAGTKDLFEKFKNYFGEEMEAIGDMTLNQEFDILEKLAQAPSKNRVETEEWREEHLELDGKADDWKY